MAGKVTQEVDEISAKSGTRVAHANLTGYKNSRSLGSLGDLDFITKEVFLNASPPFITNLQVPFSATTWTLGSYQTTYYPIFGNYPQIQVWILNPDGTYSWDNSTAPIVTYVVSGDPTSGISSISWNFPASTNGYVIISGNTNTITPGGGGNVPAGGAAAQVLAKVDGTDFNTHWVNQTGGGGDITSANFGAWTALPSSSATMINTNFPLAYKLDLTAFPTKSIVYVQGQFGLDATFFGTSLLLGTLPTGSRPAAQIKKYFIFQNVEMFLQIDTNGNVSLISKDAINLPTTSGTPEIQPYYLDLFFKPA